MNEKTTANYWNSAHERFRAKAERASAEYDRRKRRGERISQTAIAEKHGLSLQSLRKYRWRQNMKRVAELEGADHEAGSEGDQLFASEYRAMAE